jgi:hypothetical protein
VLIWWWLLLSRPALPWLLLSWLLVLLLLVLLVLLVLVRLLCTLGVIAIPSSCPWLGHL